MAGCLRLAFPTHNHDPGVVIRAAKLSIALMMLAAALAAYAAGLRPEWLLDPAAPGHRIAGPALVHQHPPKVAILGTSLTARYAWPEAMRAGVEACLGRPVTVTKTAEAGAGSGWGAEAAQGVAAEQPDLVLIEFAINDADLTDGAWLEAARRQHQAMVDTLRAAHPDIRIALVTMSPAHGARGWVRPFLGAHEDLYRRLAEDMGLDLIDLAPLWAAALKGGHAGLLPDGLHPAEAAVIEVALPTMTRQVGRVFGGNC